MILRLKSLISAYKNYLGFPLDDEDINQLYIYMETFQIKKLAHEYGDFILLLCQRYCEQQENYLCCQAIQEHIKAVNKYSHHPIETNLESFIKWNRTT